MTIAYRNDEMRSMVDLESGLVDRRIFSDQAIYEMELERIFARAWNFICHDSQIPNPGDFFMTFIGEDRVICVRDNDGNPQVLVNTCRHRGNAICRTEEGHASSFMCTYHGWTYDLKGALVGVPGFKEVYHEELDRESWGLIKAAQVDSHEGFIFATMDPEAPPFQEYIGDVGRLAFSLISERGENMAVKPGILKYIIPCNWKFAVDNVFDWYHVRLTHSSAILAGYQGPNPEPSLLDKRPSLVWLGDYGHAIGGSAMDAPVPGELPGPLGPREQWRERPEARKALGPAALRATGHPHIFPNFWVVTTSDQVSVRIPRGPMSTEMWFFTLIDQNKSEEEQQSFRSKAVRGNGPAGMFEMEDGENWGESTNGTVGLISRRYPLHYAMDIGHAEVIEPEGDLAHIETPRVNEHAQLWHYRAWSEWMSAESWSELKATHSTPPEDRV